MGKSIIQKICIVGLLIAFIVLVIYFSIDNEENENVEFGQYENKYDKKVEVISDKKEDGTYSLNFKSNKWKYDKDNDIYYQIGIVYCTTPENVDYQCLSIYVPGKFFNGKENQDGTYTCTKNNDAQVGKYTVNTAPIIIPVNTAGYSMQKSTTFYEYDGLKEYMEAGLIYVYAGCRGISDSSKISSSPAPFGVTDLKSAVRYLKYNSSEIPGNVDSIIMLGHGEGGAQVAIVGASGDSELYLPYLKQIGAPLENKQGVAISDEICGVICWCPTIITEASNAAYEWYLGQYVSTNTREKGTFTNALSDDLSIEYAKYINDLYLRDDNRNLLKLEESEHDIYTKGTYYQYVKSTIEGSLNTFIKETTFPTIIENMSAADGDFPGGSRRKRDNNSKKTQKFNSLEEYIDSLNKNGQWVNYDANTKVVTITSIKDFVNHCKKVNKDVCAFDSLGKNQVENRLFGVKDSKMLHYDSIVATLLTNNVERYSKLKKWSNVYASNYTKDLLKVDELKNTVENRTDMYNPMFYLSNARGKNNNSNIARFWRINSGIKQSNIADVLEINMYLSLKSNNDVKKVDYTTVWEQEHSMTETSGDPIKNAIDWISNSI